MQPHGTAAETATSVIYFIFIAFGKTDGIFRMYNVSSKKSPRRTKKKHTMNAARTFV